MHSDRTRTLTCHTVDCQSTVSAITADDRKIVNINNNGNSNINNNYMGLNNLNYSQPTHLSTTSSNRHLRRQWLDDKALFDLGLSTEPCNNNSTCVSSCMLRVGNMCDSVRRKVATDDHEALLSENIVTEKSLLEEKKITFPIFHRKFPTVCENLNSLSSATSISSLLFSSLPNSGVMNYTDGNCYSCSKCQPESSSELPIEQFINNNTSTFSAKVSCRPTFLITDILSSSSHKVHSSRHDIFMSSQKTPAFPPLQTFPKRKHIQNCNLDTKKIEEAISVRNSFMIMTNKVSQIEDTGSQDSDDCGNARLGIAPFAQTDNLEQKHTTDIESEGYVNVDIDAAGFSDVDKESDGWYCHIMFTMLK